MSGFVRSVNNIGGNPAFVSGYSCFVCGHNQTGQDLPLYVNNDKQGKKVANLFNEAVSNCAWLDRRVEPKRTNVKVYACNEHLSNLSELRKKIILESVLITVKNNEVFENRTITPELIAAAQLEG